VTGFKGPTADRTYRAALENPRDVRLRFPLRSVAARFMRLRLEETDQVMPWFVTDIAVHGVSALAERYTVRRSWWDAS
jgi:hypothetical protein